MAFIVEDGTVVPDANSYATVAEAEDYATDRLYTSWTSASSGKEEALIRATAAIDAMYGGRFPGYKVSGRDQSLEWPRQAAYDDEDNLIAADEVPIEIKQAVYEAAVRELAVPGSMMPDLERGGGIRSLRAGSVAIEYSDTATVTTTYSLINGILAPLLVTGSGGGMFGVAVRG